jgi:hypothetical protein
MAISFLLLAVTLVVLPVVQQGETQDPTRLDETSLENLTTTTTTTTICWNVGDGAWMFGVVGPPHFLDFLDCPCYLIRPRSVGLVSTFLTGHRSGELLNPTNRHRRVFCPRTVVVHYENVLEHNAMINEQMFSHGIHTHQFDNESIVFWLR